MRSVKRVGHPILLGACLGALVLAIGCDDASTPVGPSPVAAGDDGPAAPAPRGGGSGSQTTAPGGGQAAAAPGDEALKTTAPTPAAPIDNVEINDPTPLLVAWNARGVFVESHFDHAFVLYRTINGTEKEIERGFGTPLGAEQMSYQVRTTLDRAETYTWRVRAAVGGVFGPWSSAARFRVKLELGAPQPVAPIDDVTTSTLRPIFNVRNPPAPANAGALFIALEVATDAGFANIVGQTRTHARSRGDTNLQLAGELKRSTRYYWRARAIIGTPSATSAWSATGQFRTKAPDPPQPPPPSPPTNPPGKGDCCPPPNRLDIVQAIVRKTGNLYRSDIHEFTQHVAECLAATDGDWGRRRNDSGAVGKDTVAYRTSKGRGRGPFSIDIMLGAESSNPRPHWSVQRHDGIDGRVGGSWLKVNGANCILGGVR